MFSHKGKTMSTEAKCSCQYCNAHIAFPAEMAGQMFACPHCGLKTKLFIPNITKVPANKPPQNVSVEIKRGVSPLGIASLVLGIMGCLICWIPILGLFAIPVALIGLVLAFIGVVMAAINKKTGFVFSISGGIVCILSVCIALVTTGAVTKLYSDSRISNQTPVSTTAETSNQISIGEKLLQLGCHKDRGGMDIRHQIDELKERLREIEEKEPRIKGVCHAPDTATAF
jgi:hypothetical protein